jgi:hypothetical protein
MKSIFLGLMILLLFSSVAVVEQSQTVPEQQVDLSSPSGWSQYPKPGLESKDRLCGNYSLREWLVSFEEEQLKIRQRPLPYLYRKDSLPFEIALKKNKDQEDGLNGQRVVYKVDDGWLVGFDEGEFGGSLWWFSQNGNRYKKLTNENVIDFVGLSEKTLILTGIAHMGFDEGKILLVRKVGDGDYKLEVFADLGSQPDAYINESPDSLLIITTKALMRVTKSGTVRKLFETEYDWLGTTSIALSSKGAIYAGHRHFITRLTPVANGYEEQWFVPSDCTKFEIQDYECICSTR